MPGRDRRQPGHGRGRRSRAARSLCTSTRSDAGIPPSACAGFRRCSMASSGPGSPRAPRARRWSPRSSAAARPGPCTTRRRVLPVSSPMSRPLSAPSRAALSSSAVICGYRQPAAGSAIPGRRCAGALAAPASPSAMLRATPPNRRARPIAQKNKDRDPPGPMRTGNRSVRRREHDGTACVACESGRSARCQGRATRVSSRKGAYPAPAVPSHELGHLGSRRRAGENRVPATVGRVISPVPPPR